MGRDAEVIDVTELVESIDHETVSAARSGGDLPAPPGETWTQEQVDEWFAACLARRQRS